MATQIPLHTVSSSLSQQFQSWMVQTESTQSDKVHILTNWTSTGRKGCYTQRSSPRWDPCCFCLVTHKTISSQLCSCTVKGEDFSHHTIKSSNYNEHCVMLHSCPLLTIWCVCLTLMCFEVCNIQCNALELVIKIIHWERHTFCKWFQCLNIWISLLQNSRLFLYIMILSSNHCKEQPTSKQNNNKNVSRSVL